MRFRLLAILISLLLCIASVDAVKPKQQKAKAQQSTATVAKSTKQKAKTQQRTSTTVKNDKKSAEKKVAATGEQIRQNEAKVAKTLHEIGILDGEIAGYEKQIAVLSVRVNTLDSQVKQVEDSINILTERLNRLREAMTKSLRSTRRSRGDEATSSFILSSGSFSQAYRRVDALRQFAEWHRSKSAEIESVRLRLDDNRVRLDSMRTDLQTALNSLTERQNALQGKQQESKRLVASLQSQQQTLRNVLKKQQAEIDKFNRELNDLLAKEQAAAAARKKAEEEAARKKTEAEEAARKKAEAAKSQGGTVASNSGSGKSSGSSASSGNATANKPKPKPNTPTPAPGASFDKYKGLLPSPIGGPCTIIKRFGTRTLPSSNISYSNNPGICYEVKGSTPVRAVFEGIVSAVSLTSMNHAVIVRHGDFLTFYGGLNTPIVKTGDKVTAGQQLGTVYTHPVNETSEFRFSILDDRTKPSKCLDPELWLR